MRRLLLLSLGLTVSACDSESEKSTTTAEADADTDADTDTDTDTDADTDSDADTDADTDTDTDIDVCAVLGETARPFDPSGGGEYLRRALVEDFSLELLDGSTWSLSENWSGCESYVFVPHQYSVETGDSWWTIGLDDLIDNSPPNVHYFFVVYSGDDADIATYAEPLADDIGGLLAEMSEEDAAWWEPRLHVLGHASRVNDDIVKYMSRGVGSYGWAIDRFQRIRTLGSSAWVEAYDPSLSWPWWPRMESVAREPQYFNFEAARQERLDAMGATEIELWGPNTAPVLGSAPAFSDRIIAEYKDITVTLPDAATMQGFDTLEIDVLMECPNQNNGEYGNCGAWDYLAHLWWWNPDTSAWQEMGRFITTYHRESRWVVDASHALAWLNTGGAHTFRYQWAPSWNTQPTAVTTTLRLANQGKGYRAVEAIPLFQGGTLDANYNNREALEVDIPADAAHVEVRAIITGHGADGDGCGEFCAHGHTFDVNSYSWSHTFNEASTEQGCSDAVSNGTVPNQWGTWWFGRGGWCPGQRVDPFILDVTGDVTPGNTATISYRGTIDGAEPTTIGGDGNILMNSWLVVYK